METDRPNADGSDTDGEERDEDVDEEEDGETRTRTHRTCLWEWKLESTAKHDSGDDEAWWFGEDQLCVHCSAMLKHESTVFSGEGLREGLCGHSWCAPCHVTRTDKPPCCDDVTDVRIWARQRTVAEAPNGPASSTRAKRNATGAHIPPPPTVR